MSRFQDWVDNILGVLIGQNEVENVRHALAITTDKNVIDRLSLLHIAAQNGNPAMAEMLLDMGANVNHTITRQAFTPLHMVMTEGYLTYVSWKYVWKRVPGARRASVIGEHCAVARVLLQRGAAVDQPTFIDPDNKTHAKYGGNTALFLACLHGNEKLISLLLEYGASATKNTLSGRPPLFAAIWENPGPSDLLLKCPGVAEQLLTRRQDGNTYLMTAAAVGNCDLIRRIFAASPALLDAKTKKGNRALFFACQNNQKEAVKLLLELGSDPNAQNVLEISVRCGNLEVTRLLLEHGADPNIRNSDGFSLLMIACKSFRPQLVSFLLKHGATATINCQDYYGNTALFFAVALNQLEATKEIINAGANVNHTKEGLTALHLATWRGLSKIVKLLICCGAKTEATCDGKTPLMCMFPLDSKGIPVSPRESREPQVSRPDVQEPTENFNPLWAVCPSPLAVLPKIVAKLPTRKDVTKIIRLLIASSLDKQGTIEKTVYNFSEANYPVARWIEELKVFKCRKLQAVPVIMQSLRHAYFRPELDGCPGGPGYFKAIS